MNPNKRAKDEDPPCENSDHDIRMMTEAMKQIDAGEGLTVEQCFDPIRAKLLAMKRRPNTASP